MRISAAQWLPPGLFDDFVAGNVGGTRQLHDLRRAFSGIVAGNVKEMGIREIREKGRYKLHGDADIGGWLV
jgi:hypothetical protein